VYVDTSCRVILEVVY